MDNSILARNMFKLIPVKIPLSGIKRNTTIAVCDVVCSKPSSIYKIKTGDDYLLISNENPNERLLKYAYWNVKRYFSCSALASLIREEIPKGKIFADIGANLGFYSLIARESGIKAISFEPEPQHVAFLQRNSHVFPMVFDIALSDSDGTATFNVGTNKNQGCSSLVNSDSGRNSYYYKETVEITTRKFDSFLRENKDIKLQDIFGIKIDVEGAETKTLAGMSSFLQNSNSWIWCEVRGQNSDRGSNSYKKVLSILTQNKYSAYCYSGTTLEPFSEEKHVEQLFDILFLKSDQHANLINKLKTC